MTRTYILNGNEHDDIIMKAVEKCFAKRNIEAVYLVTKSYDFESGKRNPRKADYYFFSDKEAANDFIESSLEDEECFMTLSSGSKDIWKDLEYHSYINNKATHGSSADINTRYGFSIFVIQFYELPGTIEINI